MSNDPDRGLRGWERVLAAAALATCAGVVCLGCGDDAASTSASAGGRAVRLLVRAEGEVASRTAFVHVRAAGLSSLPQPGQPLPELAWEHRLSAFAWPFELELPGGVTASEAFWVEVQVLDVAEQPLTEVRLSAALLEGVRLEPELVLRDRCLDWVCGNPFASCADLGSCEPAIKASEDLPQTPLD